MQDIIAAKALLRQTAIARRDRLAPELRSDAAESIARHGIGFAGAAPGCVVSGFVAIGAEIDPLPLMIDAAARGHSLALPVITKKGNPLLFRCWGPGAPLAERLWGIREPLASAPEVEPDVLLVPLLAFDRRGFRLGYGAGYYDRTLAKLRAKQPTVAIGIAYDEQEVEEVPVDSYDQRLDWVLTPKGPRRFG